MDAFAAAAVISIAIQTALFLVYARYIQRLRVEKCACALTPRFELIVKLFRYVVILYYVTLVGLALLAGVRAAGFPVVILAAAALLGGVLSVALSALVVKWWFEMRAAACACSNGYEKTVWAGLSAYHIASIVIGVFSGLLTAAC